jgi:hypothetical protein
MDEFREIVKLGPVLLRRDDLASLEQLLLDGVSLNPNYPPAFGIEDGPRRFTAHSMTELLQKTPPRSYGNFTATLNSWDEKKDIDSGIILTLNKNYGNFQLFARNETLFLGKKQQLVQFFRDRRPWYGWITQMMPFAGAPVAITALFFSAALFSQGRLVASGLSLVLGLTTGAMLWLAFQNRMFPYIRVMLTEPQKRPGTWETVTFVLGVALLVATIISIALPLTRVEQKRQDPATPSPSTSAPKGGASIGKD